jgi:hypothetical protein
MTLSTWTGTQPTIVGSTKIIWTWMMRVNVGSIYKGELRILGKLSNWEYPLVVIKASMAEIPIIEIWVKLEIATAVWTSAKTPK